MYILGIDGGGTKLELALADVDENILFETRVEANSNLKYTTPEKIIQNLERSLNQLPAKYKLSDIQYAYLGIAECGPDGVGQGRDKILAYLQTKFNKFDLQDDQYSVFRAGAPTNFGVLANAGTGSNINNFTPDQAESYKSLGIGGRDFGKMILGLAVYGGIDPESEIYRLVSQLFDCDPIEFYYQLSAEEKIKHPLIPEIPKTLILAAKQNPTLQKEMKAYETILANRWSNKLTSYLRLNFGYDFEVEFDLVLSGSLWKWAEMRLTMIKELKAIYPAASIHFNPDLKPVLGCIEIASEKVKFEL